MDDDFTKFNGRIIERKVISIYMLFILVVLVAEIAVKGNIWFIMWTLPEAAVCLMVYFMQAKDENTRAYIITSMAMVSFFGHGIFATSLFSVLPSFGVLLLLIGLFNIPRLLGMVSALVLGLAWYHAFALHLFSYNNMDALLNMVQQILPMFIMIHFSLKIIKRVRF